jgi:tetratricopeptide (TPR) repeat protein
MMLKAATTETVKPMSGPTPTLEVEARIVELRAEAEAASDRTLKAALLYEVAHLTETRLRNAGKAVQDYLAAYNADHKLRLPLYALLRIFERKRSTSNLQRLYDAELRTARTAVEKADALIDQGVLASSGTVDLEVARAHYERALEQLPEAASAALLLEWNRRAARDPEGTAHALLRRAETCDDPLHRGVLLLEVASLREAAGEVGAALEALRLAALGARPHEVFLIALSRFARTHNHVQELVEATERLAELATERMARERPDAGSEAQAERSEARAVALWYEAARLRAALLGDAEGALSCLSKAAELRPNDVLLRQTRMLAYDMLEDRARAAEEAQTLLSQGFEGEHAAALHFRLAENALVNGDTDTARERLMEAVAQSGGSVAADAILDDLLLDDERHRERVARREERAAHEAPPRAGRWLLEAATIAANDLGDHEAALALISKALDKAAGDCDAQREAYGVGLDIRSDAIARVAIDGLLTQPLDEDEKTALVHHRLELSPSVEASAAWIAEHEQAVLGRPVLATMGALRAAEAQSHGLLARAHESTAEAAASTEHAVAHLCAAARAHLRDGNTQAAEAALRSALSRSPAQRYALTLLEELLREKGESDEVVELLRRSAEAQVSSKDAELSLLLAGAAAEGGGDLARAVQAYEEAADRNPASVGPLWALLRLGQRQHDAGLELRAREGLAERERAEGQASIESLLLGEHYDLACQKPELSEASIASVLEDPSAGVHAAAALLILRADSHARREQATAVLAERASPTARAWLLREQSGQMLARGAPVAETREVLHHLLELRGEDRWARLVEACLPEPGKLREHAAALEAFVALTDDAALKDALRAEALLSRRLEAGEQPLEDDLAALGLSSDEPLGVRTAQTVLDIVDLSRPKERVKATDALLDQATPAERGELLHAMARHKLLADDPAAAADACEELLATDPNDLAMLELLRVAARRTGRFDRVARACEALAEHVDGELWAQLLEEAAIVRIDHLQDVAGAERILLQIMAKHPKRTIAYGRLHDLLSEREDSEALTQLVERRSTLIDDPAELAGLFYELARLRRAAGDLEGALDALDHLSMLEEHVGGLALAVEIHTAQENWPLAVEALQGLASADDVPKAQRRLARLGAADFLENRLGDARGALSELQKLETEGNADSALYTRMADVAERASDYALAVRSLTAAAEQARGDARINALMRAADLLHRRLDDAREAETMYERVLALRPGHTAAARALSTVATDEQRKALAITRFENEVRAECATHPTEGEPLRKLLALSELRADPDVAFIALSALCTLDLANVGERDAADVTLRRALAARINARAPVTTADLRELFTPAVDDRYAAFAQEVFSAAAEIDRLEPSRFGVGRGQRVSPKEGNQVRDELHAMAQALGFRLGEFYVGGEEGTRIAALPKDDECSLVVGVGVTAPLGGARRYQAALQLAAFSQRGLPLLTRTPAQAARLLHACIALAECPLPPGVDRDDLGELPKTLGRQLPRKVRKALPDLARALPEGGARLERHCRLAQRHLRRLALAMSAELAPALESVLGAMPSREAIAGSEDATDLLRAWTSAPMLSLRKNLGLSR